jgi:phosphotransferase system enzyme I (PtsI)
VDTVARITGGSIVAADDITPSAFLAADWTRGGAIALAAGSPSSHVAMLARARGAPMVVGLGPLSWNGQPPALALVDGDAGSVIFDPEPETRRRFEQRMAAANAELAAAEAGSLAPACTVDGRRIAVLLNITAPEDLAGLDPAICDGIGLVRTEFLFEASHGLPDEDTQYAIYRRILEWAQGRPVTIRTLDAGGDKPIKGLTIDGESNPFLGLRGIRLSLARPDVFRVQLRALSRAAVHGVLKVMLPMIAVPAELDRAAVMLDAEFAALKAAGIACARPPLGIMIEVPAAALCAEDFNATFYSIGSNDLTQYTMAAARDIGSVADLNDAGHPAVLALIARTVEAARKRDVEVSLCGDAAADTRLTTALLVTGLTRHSVAPVTVALLKATIAKVDSRAGS